ncbi:hypothetical protein Hanom_Chr08g00700391 [Helianthus anomalus]
MSGMSLSSMGCVFGAKPNKKWTRVHGMGPWNEPSCTRCVQSISEASGELQVFGEFLKRCPVRFRCHVRYLQFMFFSIGRGWL